VQRRDGGPVHGVHEVLPARFTSTPRPAAAETAAAETAATETGAAGGLRTSLVDGEAAPTNQPLIQVADGGLRAFFRAHLDEREPTGAAGSLVPHDTDRVHRRHAREEILQFCFTDLVRQVTDVKLATHHVTPSAE